MKTVCLLGASGSIGNQTIDVIMKNPEDFSLRAISVGKRIKIISKLLKKFDNLSYICVQKEEDYKKLKDKYPAVHFYYGNQGLISLIKECKTELYVNALVGFVGLLPSITILEENKILCLANKESLVVGGEIINNLLKKGKGKLYPIDSEHVALAKCLSVDNKNVDKLIITASGGAFRNLTRKELKNVTKEDALNHPTWKMGEKITIDSASMVNKTFEVIEAHFLFGYSLKNIEIVLNYNSYVHSLVLYKNKEYRLDLGKPDMRNPIKYALYEGLTDFDLVVTNDLTKIKNTTFAQFDKKRYPVVKHANLVIEQKGTYGAALNAANEVAVKAFLDGEIGFLGIEKLINIILKNHVNKKSPNYEDLLLADQNTRDLARNLIKEGGIK